MTFKRFCLDTFYGPLLLWALSAGAALASLALCTFTLARILLLAVALPLLLLCTILGIVAFVRSLLAKAWLRATLQLVLGLGLAVGAVVGAFLALLAGSILGFALQPPESGWTPAGAGLGIPFTVEYKPCHPFLAEYNRRVVFPSGKRIGIGVDPGGYPRMSVYAIDDAGTYCLSDGQFSQAFRIGMEAETVDWGNGFAWFRLPDDFRDISFSSGDYVVGSLADGREIKLTDSVPYGTTLDSRRLLGAVGPGGGSEPPDRAPDFLAAPVWQRADCPDTLPFAIEYSSSPTRPSQISAWRVRFPTGETSPLFLDTLPVFSDPSYALYQLHTGDYCLKDESGEEFCKDFRIRPADRAVDIYASGGGLLPDLPADAYCDPPAWVLIPPDLRTLEMWSTGSLRGRNENGIVVSPVTYPVGDTLDSPRLLGTLSADGRFTPAP